MWIIVDANEARTGLAKMLSEKRGRGGTLIYLNDGAGSFIERVALGWADFLSVGDVDGDVVADIVVQRGSMLTVLINDGSANFSFTEVSVAGRPLDSTLADLNGDGALDIVMACQGDGNFVEDGRYGASASHVVTGDLDGDGDVDLFNDNGAVYVNAGDGTFSGDVGFADLTQLLNAFGDCTACPEDLDGDGSVGFSDMTALLANWGPCVSP